MLVRGFGRTLLRYRALCTSTTHGACADGQDGTYIQAQSPRRGIREYFYTIDHQGQVFLDDVRMKNFTSCFKDKTFLQFFLTRVRPNDTGRYMNSFPFVSMCGRERNFIRCDDTPLVYTHLLDVKTDEPSLAANNLGEAMCIPFEAEHLYMEPTTGRVYYPADEKFGSFALIRTQLSIELASLFRFANGESTSPTHIQWKNELRTLSGMLHTVIIKRPWLAKEHF